MITTLSQLVARVESSGRPGALRLEPLYKPSQAALAICARYNPGLSLATREMICRTSWGLYQVMGDNLYLQGLETSILDFWKDEGAQLGAFKRYVVRRGIDYTLDEILTDKKKREHFALRYNGSIKYAARLIEIYNSLKA